MCYLMCYIGTIIHILDSESFNFQKLNLDFKLLLTLLDTKNS